MESTLNINRLIDHTLLKPEATKEQIKKLCLEALEHHFFSVCINPYNVPYASELLAGSDVSVCTVIGFPLGANATETKVFETSQAIGDGAHEIDMVINVGALKNKEWDKVKNDIQSVVEAAGDKIVKVIFETCLLTDSEKIKACELASAAGARFVKTSTGFSSSGATLEDVELMKKNILPHMEVKASGGVRDLAAAVAFIKAGATRLGTSSGIAILSGQIVEKGVY
ncbi:MAG: deoxyribose-phosphate aldolase [Alphaproteobacteria bacterium]|nr:MAG: deoxyribose-phosphate aldolase [Alphaproteobacteria bacterium]